MKNINHNGRLQSADQPIIGTGNRVFRYGDGLFESIRMIDGNIPLLDRHLKRLYKGMKFLQYEIPGNYSTSFFQKEINKITGGKGNFRLRLTVYREDGGFYTPLSNQACFVIEAIPALPGGFELNKKGLHLGRGPDLKIPCTSFSNIKSCNALSYVMVGIWLNNQEYDECLVLNEYGRVAECSKGNIFIQVEDYLVTPPLSEGCIEGVMRSLIIDVAKSISLPVVERPINTSDLYQAEEVFVTNAIRGVNWVEKFEKKGFQNKYARQLSELIMG